MAEALSVISGIAAVLSISCEVCRKVTTFVLSTKWAGKKKRDLQNELFCLSRALARVQNVLFDHPDSSPDALRLDSAVGDCRAVLQELEITYSYQTSMNRLRRRLTWTKKPFDGSKPSPDLKRPERCRRLLEQWQPLPERRNNVLAPRGQVRLCDEVSHLLANCYADVSAAYGTVTDKNTARTLGITPLHEAAWVGAVNVVSLLLKYGADPLCCDAHLRTPLHYAAGCDRNGILKVLLETGSYDSPDLLDVNQHTPLHLAAFAGHANIIQILLTFGAKIDLPDSAGRTVLRLAAENGHSAVCADLIAAGSGLMERDLHGLTPLHSASISGHELMARTLLGRRVDLSATTEDLLTPLHCATLSGNQSVVKSQLTNGADINAQNGRGETSLFMAVNNGNYNMAEKLLTWGADVELRNSEGCSISSYADRKGQGMMIPLLCQYGA